MNLSPEVERAFKEASRRYNEGTGDIGVPPDLVKYLKKRLRRRVVRHFLKASAALGLVLVCTAPLIAAAMISEAHRRQGAPWPAPAAIREADPIVVRGTDPATFAVVDEERGVVRLVSGGEVREFSPSREDPGLGELAALAFECAILHE